MTRPAWQSKPKRTAFVPVSAPTLAANRRKLWRALIEPARALAANPEGDALELAHQAKAVRLGRLRGADPAFAGVGAMGEASGWALVDLAEAFLDAAPERRALAAPALRELAEACDAFLVEAQTQAAERWQSTMRD